MSGNDIRILQYFLAFAGYFNDNLPVIPITGVFDNNTRNAVLTFQSNYGLTPDGIVGVATWNRLLDVYSEKLNELSSELYPNINQIFKGRFLSLGIEGDDVEELETFMQAISEAYPGFPEITPNGIYEENEERFVRLIQEGYDLPVTGIVDPITWLAIVTLYNSL